MAVNILVATPISSFGELIRSTITGHGDFLVTVCETGDKTLEALAGNVFDVLILDSALSDQPFVPLVHKIMASLPKQKIAVIPPENKPDHPQMGDLMVHGYLSRPFLDPDLINLVQRLATAAEEDRSRQSQGVKAYLSSEKSEISWMEDQSLAEVELSHLLLGSSALAGLIIHEGEIWVNSGRISTESSQEINLMLSQVKADKEKDLVRFTFLVADDCEALVYAIQLIAGWTLALVYDVSMPLTRVRNQAAEISSKLRAQVRLEELMEKPDLVGAQNSELIDGQSASGQTISKVPTEEGEKPSEIIMENSGDLSEVTISESTDSTSQTEPIVEDSSNNSDTDEGIPETKPLKEPVFNMPSLDDDLMALLNNQGISAEDVHQIEIEKEARQTTFDKVYSDSLITNPTGNANSPEEEISQQEIPAAGEILPTSDDAENAQVVEKVDSPEERLPELEPAEGDFIAADNYSETESSSSEEVVNPVEAELDEGIKEPVGEPAFKHSDEEMPTDETASTEVQTFEEMIPSEELVDNTPDIVEDDEIIAGTPPLVDQEQIVPQEVEAPSSQIPTPIEIDPEGLQTITVVFTPQNSGQFLTGELGSYLGELIKKLSGSFDWKLKGVAIRPEYMRLTIQVSEFLEPEDIVKLVQEYTSWHVNERFSYSHEQEGKESFWAPDTLLITDHSIPDGNEIRNFLQSVKSQSASPTV
jgi:REP element-mobilizing transposase RayT/DNA-binding NarL/FixJ family response regulator